MTILRRFVPFGIATLLLIGCGSTRQLTPSKVLLHTYGGSNSFSKAELDCLQRNKRLLSFYLENSENDGLEETFQNVPHETFECFGRRVIDSMTMPSISNQTCLRERLYRSLELSIESGARSLFTALTDSKVAVAAVEACGSTKGASR
jgi:hypothetical protein